MKKFFRKMKEHWFVCTCVLLNALNIVVLAKEGNIAAMLWGLCATFMLVLMTGLYDRFSTYLTELSESYDRSIEKLLNRTAIMSQEIDRNEVLVKNLTNENAMLRKKLLSKRHQKAEVSDEQ